MAGWDDRYIIFRRGGTTGPVSRRFYSPVPHYRRSRPVSQYTVICLDFLYELFCHHHPGFLPTSDPGRVVQLAALHRDETAVVEKHSANAQAMTAVCNISAAYILLNSVQQYQVSVRTAAQQQYLR